MTQAYVDTGEVIEDDAPQPRALSRVVNDSVPVPRQSRDVAGVIAMLEDGDFNLEASEDMRELVQFMEGHAHNNKGSAKGKVTITLDLHLANGIFVITGQHAVKRPVAKRVGTALFARDDGGLGKNPAGQYQRLGEERDARDAVIEQHVRDI